MASFFVYVALALCTSLFCIGVAQAHSESPHESTSNFALAQDPVWMSLLHYSHGRTHITDPNFILSHNNFSLSAELQATINAFYSDNAQEVLCRFPARYFWLKQHVTLPSLSYELCVDLKEFETRAPADKVSVVYVSENVAQPSSMMGHLFLKVSGVNIESQSVEHAISFYTDAKTINVPKLIYESTIKGKKGFFTLTPYSEKVNSYVHDEQRNLWELELQLTDEQRRLVQLHLYELKQTEFKYFFQSYNCATVINFIVSLAMPELREGEGVWVTPLDIAKKINQSQKVISTQVQTSSPWRLRMLQTQLPNSLTQKIGASVDRGAEQLPTTDSERQAFLSLEFARSYNDYRFEKKLIDVTEWNITNKNIAKANNLEGQFAFDLSEYKNPLKTQPDSQFWIGVVNQTDNWYLRTGIMPASHSLEDDNRQYFGETGLHLASLSVLTNLETGKAKLESFELYSAESIVPYNKFTGGMSGRFAIGIAPVYNQSMTLNQQAYIKGSLGFSYSLSEDLDVYTLLGCGLGFANGRAYMLATPEVGVVVREVFDMKTMLSVSQAYNNLAERNRLNEFSFTQAKYLPHDYALFFHLKRSSSETQIANHYDVTLKKYF